MIVRIAHLRRPFRTDFLGAPLPFVVLVTGFDLALADLRAVFLADFRGAPLLAVFAAPLLAPRLAVFFAGRRVRRAGSRAIGGTIMGSLTNPSAANGM